MYEVIAMDIRTLRAPARLLVAGPSRAGKTVFCLKLVKHAKIMFSPSPKRIVWLYNNDQTLYHDVKGVEFHKGFDILQELTQGGNQPCLVVMDDLMTKSNLAREIFTRFSHHCNLSVIFITQNLFYKGAGFRDITLSASYVVIFKNPRDSSTVNCFSRQMLPHRPKLLTQAYHRVTVKPFSYLFIDLTQEMPEEYRIRANIFPDEEMIVYCVE